jgi:hypothetical protein
MIEIAIAIGIIVVLAFVLIPATVRIVRQYEIGVLFRLAAL